MRLTGIDKEIRFVGLKRSGSHAVLNWIIRQSPGSVMHFNNVRPDDPFQPGALATATHPELPKQDTVIYSVEDTSLQLIADCRSHAAPPLHPELQVGSRLDVLVLRDPFNLFASRLNRGGAWGRLATYSSGLTAPQLWVTYALEYLGRTAWLSPDCVRVDYNRWCRSAEYRRGLAQQLGLAFTDAGFEQVPRFGGGSSFDGTQLDGRASAMRTDQRWPFFRDHPGYRDLFRDPLLLDLAAEIFEPVEELERFAAEVLRPRASRLAALDRALRCRALVPAILRLRRSGPMRRLHRSVLRPWKRRQLPMGSGRRDRAAAPAPR